jgi:hypothetical protein
VVLEPCPRRREGKKRGDDDGPFIEVRRGAEEGGVWVQVRPHGRRRFGGGGVWRGDRAAVVGWQRPKADERGWVACIGMSRGGVRL